MMLFLVLVIHFLRFPVELVCFVYLKLLVYHIVQKICPDLSSLFFSFATNLRHVRAFPIVKCLPIGDKEVVAAMKEFGDYTDQARFVKESPMASFFIFGLCENILF